MNKESISSHLLELRTRLIRILIFMGFLSIIGIPFASEIYAFVASPLLDILPQGSTMIATQVTSPFMAPLKLVLFSALLVTMPYLIILFFVIGMLLTPPDIFSQLFLALPMWLLFEVGLLISREK